LFNKSESTKEKLFEETIIALQKDLYKLAYYYVKNENDAMDILQDSIIKSYTNLHKLKDINSLDKWIKRIVINTSIDFIRKNNRLTSLGEEELINLKDSKEDNRELIHCLEDLDPQLKTIIILKYFHGYTINEIADILELSISKVKNKLHKSLELLRINFKEDNYERAILWKRI